MRSSICSDSSLVATAFGTLLGGDMNEELIKWIYKELSEFGRLTRWW